MIRQSSQDDNAHLFAEAVGMKQIATFLLCVLALTACSHRSKDDAYYTRKAYKEQRWRQDGPRKSASVDQQSHADALLSLDEEIREEWQRLPWETVDEWMERIQTHLALNRERISALRDTLGVQQTEEKRVVASLQAVIAKNEEMRELVSELQPKDGLAQADIELFQSLPEPTFRLHLIRRGDTLFSIANYYYQDPQMITDIMLWNQGWLRNQHQLLAGVAIVLFDSNTAEKNEQVVEEYLRRIPAYQ